jgi:hypothetical protein
MEVALEFEGMKNLQALYELAKKEKITELGSSSFDPSLARSCAEIRNKMSAFFSIWQKGGTLNKALRNIGDDSGVLYIGGKQWDTITETYINISTAQYIEYLAQILDKFSREVKDDLEKICGEFIVIQNMDGWKEID